MRRREKRIAGEGTKLPLYPLSLSRSLFCFLMRKRLGQVDTLVGLPSVQRIFKTGVYEVICPNKNSQKNPHFL